MFIKYSRTILIITLLITAAALYFSTKLRFNYDFESYFPSGDPDLEYYQEYRERFGDDSRFLLIGVQNSKGIFNQAFLQKIDSLTSFLKSLEQTEEVVSPATLKEPVITPMGPVQIPLLHIDQPHKYAGDSAKIFSKDHFSRAFFPSGAKDVILMISVKEDLSREKGEELLDRIYRTLEEFNFEETHVSGKLKVQSGYIQRMQEELLIFLSASIVLITIFLATAYRTIWGIIIPILTVILSIIWTMGLMGLTNQPLDLMTTLLPPILFIVGMSDVIHLLTKYIDELKKGKSKPEALKIAYREIGLATFITSVTTAIGFGTLINSNVSPIQSFGIYTCAGVFIAFGLAFSFFPAFLIRFRKPIFSARVSQNSFWQKYLHNSFRWVINQRRTILISSFLLTGAAIYFTTQISMDSTLLDDIGENDPIKQDSRYLEEKFGGVRPVEIGIKSSKDVLTPDVLQEIVKIEEYLKTTYGAVYINSPATYVKAINKALNGGNQAYYKLPEKDDEWRKVEKYLSILRKKENSKEFANGSFGRISGRIGDLGHEIVAEKNIALKAFIDENINAELINYRLTGSALLVDKNNYLLTRNLLKNLSIALILVGIIMGFIFRSWKMAFVAMIPNIIPLLMIGALMGIFGINLKPSTSIIFSIAFGIAVDDSIHFLSRLKLQLDSGKSFLYAIKRTFLGTGKAMIITSLILVSGFLSLILSSFEGTFYTGLLVSLTLFFALAGDLIILPVLLIGLRKWIFKERK